MNIFNNNRTLFWILIFLVLVNLSILAGYFVFMHSTGTGTVAGTNGKPGWALQKELSLTPAQTVEVRNINSAYKAASEPLISGIKETKADLLEELTKENPDTIAVAKLADIINAEQQKLQKANIQQFLDLKKICTPEQVNKLSQLYSELYGCSNNNKGKGQGSGNGMMHRYRHGQNTQKDSTRNKRD